MYNSITDINTQQVKEMRDTYIGGSEMGAIMGLDPWKTPLEVYYSKVEPDRIEQNYSPKTEIGTHIESFIADCYKRKTDSQVIEYPQRITHNKHSFLGGHIDRLVLQKAKSIMTPPAPNVVLPAKPDQSEEFYERNRILECKNTGGFGSKLLWEDGLPSYYFTQVQFYLMLTNLKYADVAVLKDGWDFSIITVEREEDFIEFMEEAAVAFWHNHILAKVPPDAKTEGDFKLMYPNHLEGKIATADSVMVETYKELVDVRDKLKDLTKHESLLELKVKEFLQDSEALIVEGRPVITYRTSKESQTYNWKQFAADNPNLIQDYKITKPGARRFVFKV